MADSKITLEIDLDNDNVIKGIKQIQKGFKNTERKVDANTKAMKRDLASVAATSATIGNASSAAFLPLIASLKFVGVLLGGLFVKKTIDAAIKQENAINSMNQALKSAGRFSKDASLDFQNFANQIQATTVIGDESALELLSLAGAFARTNDEAKQLVSAAIEMSAALGIDVKSAIQQLGKTTGGALGRLGELIPVTKTLTQEQLKAGAAIKLVADRFAGSAQAQIETFGGKVTQLSNAFGDLFESIGMFFTQSKNFNNLVKLLTEGFALASDAVRSYVKENDDTELGKLNREIQKQVDTLVELNGQWFGARKGLQALQKQQELGAKISKKTIDNAWKTVDALDARRKATSALVAELKKQAEALKPPENNVVVPLDPKKVLENQTALNDVLLAQQIERVRILQQNAVDELNISKAVQFEKIAIELQALQRIDALKKQFYEDGKLKAGIAEEDINKVIANEIANRDRLIAQADARLLEKQKQTYQQILQSTNQLLVNGVGGAFERLGATLVNGGTAWSDWSSFILGILGDFAIQVGSLILAQGLAINSLSASLASLNGAAAIAAGAALIALGGALKALSGKSGGSSGVSTGGGGAGAGASESNAPFIPGFSPESETASEASTQVAQTQTQITLNIEGSVYSANERETAMSIAETLSQAFDQENVRLRGAFA